MKAAKNVAFVEHMDFHIGRVLDGLKEHGFADNTIVISSDMADRCVTSKRAGSSEAASRTRRHCVPTRVVWPGKIRNNRVDIIGITMILSNALRDRWRENWPRDRWTFFAPISSAWKRNGFNDRELIWVCHEGGATGYQGRAYYAIRKGP